tara:strand:- start:296 stop:490 length:195 start_codon:yes stop_codon:yes gene_type:complete
MGNTNVCTICGSSDIVSDRSLGGKMVCSRCGSSSFSKNSFHSIKNKKKFVFILVGVFVFLIIIL